MVKIVDKKISLLEMCTSNKPYEIYTPNIPLEVQKLNKRSGPGFSNSWLPLTRWLSF